MQRMDGASTQLPVNTCIPPPATITPWPRPTRTGVLWGVSGSLVLFMFIYAAVGTFVTTAMFGRVLTTLFYRCARDRSSVCVSVCVCLSICVCLCLSVSSWLGSKIAAASGGGLETGAVDEGCMESGVADRERELYRE